MRSRFGRTQLLTRRQMLMGATATVVATGCDIGGSDNPSDDSQGSGSQQAAFLGGSPYPALAVPSLPPVVRIPLVVMDVAGSGEFGDAGDGGPASRAQFRSVGGVAVDALGQIYVSDPQANRIRRIGADGVIQTVAGTGVRGSAGDGGPATQAELTEPTRLLVDGAGVLLIAELNRIRRVGVDGTISTLIGDGQPGLEGDDGPAVFARVAGNAGMALDGEGTLFIAERAAHRIRRIGADGIVTTMAGTGVAGSFGDGGPAAVASLNEPVDVEVDAGANVIIAELGGNRIRRVFGQLSGGEIQTLAGTGVPGLAGDGGPAAGAQFNGPQAVTVDSDGHVFVADWNNRRVRRIDVQGGVSTVAGLLEGSPISGRMAKDTRIELPVDVAITPGGDLLVVEQGNRRLRALVSSAEVPPEPTERNVAVYQPAGPARALPPPVTGPLMAEVFAGGGEAGYDGEGGLRLEAVFSGPRGIGVDGAGRVLIADTGNHRVRRIELDGRVWTVAGDGTAGFGGDGTSATAAQLSRPHHVVVDEWGSLYIADAGNFRVRRVGSDGLIQTLVGGNAPGSTGDGGPAISALLTEPVAIALDRSGRVYVVDAPGHRVRRIDLDGIISTVAGSGIKGALGDGGLGSEAAVGFPQRAVVDAAGDLLISQLQGGVVRRLRGDGIIELAAGSADQSAPAEGAAASVGIEAPIGLAADAAGGYYVVASGSGTITEIRAGAARVIAGDPGGSGQPGGRALEIPLFTAIDMAIAGDGTIYLLEARGIVWRLTPEGQSRAVESLANSVSEDGSASSRNSDASPRPIPEPSENESAIVKSVTLALDLDDGQRPVDPSLEFHPGERVNISVVFEDIVDNTRLGIRWFAGDREIGRFLTDPVTGTAVKTYGFWFFLPDEAAEGRWNVEVLVGTQAVIRADFVVVEGPIRIDRGST